MQTLESRFAEFILRQISRFARNDSNRLVLTDKTTSSIINSQGRHAGVLSVLGIATGSIIHTLFAAFGLSIIIAKSVLLFNIIKYVGAGYIAYIGIKMLLDKSQLDFSEGISQSKNNAVKIYRDAVLTNVLNPKVAMFFIAFLPTIHRSGCESPRAALYYIGINLHHNWHNLVHCFGDLLRRDFLKTSQPREIFNLFEQDLRRRAGGTGGKVGINGSKVKRT